MPPVVMIATVLLAVQRFARLTMPAMAASAPRRPRMPLDSVPMMKSRPPPTRISSSRPPASRVTMISSDIPAMPWPTAPSQSTQVSSPIAKPIRATVAMPAESTTVTLSPQRASTMISRYGSARYQSAAAWTGASVTSPPRITYRTVTARKAGSTMRRFARNLSRISQPAARVEAMVVSEMKERLSPKKEPPTITAAI